MNAWYQPERNSITFPYAAWNPPYFKYESLKVTSLPHALYDEKKILFSFEYPRAYNYAGQGGTGGHELTHAFDDEGTTDTNFPTPYLRETVHPSQSWAKRLRDYLWQNAKKIGMAYLLSGLSAHRG
ncbi:hypothetical protein KIN20_033685 [Parelaphostrongylus tenuis]|uniref:Peptidase M13 C-terminal domain-containing protein n=1 Tax=Parelaphostrongylus tenuis TaxID=148309 RepID=A0AAD5R8E7_PARTN|nr:hypothetical protein KIN20_033685 [Parelaphostrongylus tenuis]